MEIHVSEIDASLIAYAEGIEMSSVQKENVGVGVAIDFSMIIINTKNN